MKTVFCVLKGHAFQYEVQTAVQIFFPYVGYHELAAVSSEGLTVASHYYAEKNQALAELYDQGIVIKRYVFPESLSANSAKSKVKASIYYLLKEYTGISPPWGMLTGIRPTKLLLGILEQNGTKVECEAHFKRLDVSGEKFQLLWETARAEQLYLASASESIGIYIGIPFCPTRCLYCSFTSYPVQQYGSYMEPYLDRLCQEIQAMAGLIQNKKIESVYIGGGTPTALSEKQLDKLLAVVKENFSGMAEWTVEAGRPDSFSRGKFQLLKDYGVNRVSINPQTMNDDTLARIGREHTAKDIQEAFSLARSIGHENINMDLIVGLPGEGVSKVRHTMQEIYQMKPEGITVHTLAVKRGSRLKENFTETDSPDAEDVNAMLAETNDWIRRLALRPYYLYRQKNMLGNFENVGYAAEKKACIYNIQMMEERQTILSFGAGAVTKLVFPKENRVERVFNVKSLTDYINRIDEMIDRKIGKWAEWTNSQEEL